jgi:uncharacterized repeat protein (TIGR01451 family)
MRRLSTLTLAAVLAALVSAVAVAAPSTGSSDLMITKTANTGTTTVGSNLIYTIGVQNLGPEAATGVNVTDSLPREVDYVSATSSVGQCALQGRSVTCGIGGLEFGPSSRMSSATVTLTVAVRRSGTIRNTASVNANQRDPVKSNNNSTAIVRASAEPKPTARATCRGQLANVVGTGHADFLTGTAGRDVIAARGGNDTIASRGGPDLICAGGGRDSVNSGPGADRVFAGGGADRVRGRGGPDVLRGGAGFDTCRGGAGVDSIRGCER